MEGEEDSREDSLRVIRQRHLGRRRRGTMARLLG